MQAKTPRTAVPFPSLPRAFAGALLFGLTLVACSDSKPPPAAKPVTPAAPAPAQAKGAEAGKGTKGAGKAGKEGKNEASALLAYNSGRQLLLRGDPEKARDELLRATTLDPKMAAAFFELGKLEFHLSSKVVGSSARDLDILDQGIAALAKAVELEPGNDQYVFWLGRAYSVPGKSDAATATKYLAHAVELNPKNALAWKSLGIVQIGESQAEAARDSFQKSIAADATDPGAYFQLGMALEFLNDQQGARAAYEKSVEIDPTQSEVYGKLVHLLPQLGDESGAAQANAKFQEWLEYDNKLQRRMKRVNQEPSDAARVRLLGEAYAEVAKWDEAAEWFVKAIHIDAKDAKAHLDCGIARRHLKDYEAATNHLKEAEFLAPDYLDAKLELLRLYADTKDDKSLDELLKSVEEAASEDGRSLYDLGQVCQEIGRAEDAARLLAKAKALGVTQAASPAPPEGG